MRTHTLTRLPLLLAFAVSPFLHAQFYEPTTEELKMIADPKAPGASAVYFLREETADYALNTWILHERIKVLTEKGKEMATVRIPYEWGIDKVAEIQGRTIHADGTVFPMTEKPSDLMDFKTKGLQVNALVFTLPNVEAGSILEYQIKIQYGNLYAPTWMVQQTLFVHKANYLLKCGGACDLMSYVWSLGPDAKVTKEKGGSYSLVLNDVPPLPDEDWMPPLNTFKWRVDFFFSTYKTNAAFWEDSGKLWSSMVREFIGSTGTLKKAVAELVGPADSETQKAQKIYAAVMKIENTDFTRHKSKVERKKEKIKDINKAEDVWKQQRGGSDEIALLYVAMARTAGLNVEPMVVVNRNRALFDESLQNARQMDDYIAVAQLDGKEVFLDPGEKLCPFGTLHWIHSVASGFRLNDKIASIARTPALGYKASTIQRVAELTIDPDGGVSGTVRFIMTGQVALHWRQLTLQNDEEEVKKQFNESMRNDLPDGVQADFDHFLGLEEYGSNLAGIIKVSGNIGTATGKRFFLPGLFFEAKTKHPFVAQDKRTTPIDVHYPKTEEDDVTYHLPAGYAVESAPQATDASWPGHAVLKITSKASPDAVNMVRTLLYNYTVLQPADYSSLHDFYQKVAAADQQQLVLTRATATKGN